MLEITDIKVDGVEVTPVEPVIDPITPVADPPVEPVVADPPVVDPPVVDPPATEPVVDPPSPQPSFSDLLKEKYGVDEAALEERLRKAELLKDDYITEAAKYYKEKGSMSEYLDAHSYDFPNMDARGIISYDIKKANPGISQKALNSLVERELVDKYGQVPVPPEFDEDGEPTPGRQQIIENREIGKELLDLQMARRKGELVEAQKKFKAPERVADPEPDNSGFLEKVHADHATKSIKEAKTLKFGDYAHGVEPDSLIESAIDQNQFWSNFQSAEGGVDFGKYYQVAAFAKNPTAIIDGLVKHGMALAKAEMVKTDKNAVPPSSPSPHIEAGDITDVRERS